MASTRGGKYYRFYEHLRGRPDTEWVASFREIEEILGFSLPASARAHHAWWANSRVGHNYASSWLDAGWRKRDLKRSLEQVTFYRPPVGDLPVEPDLSKRTYLVKVGSADCPGKIGNPETAADWEGGIFQVEPPKKSEAKPRQGDLVLIWVNGPGCGLIATAVIRDNVLEDISTITIADVKLLPGRRLDGDILHEFKEQDPYLRELQSDRPSKLRLASPEMWRHLFAMREALNSGDELDDAERVGIARMVAAVRSRVAASGRTAEHQISVPLISGSGMRVR